MDIFGNGVIDWWTIGLVVSLTLVLFAWAGLWLWKLMGPRLRFSLPVVLFLLMAGVATVEAQKAGRGNAPPRLPQVGESIDDAQNRSSGVLQNCESLDCDRFTEINVTTNGVALTLHRPITNALEAVEVTVAGSTNLVAATWESYTNVVFAAGVTNVGVFISCEMMAAHSVSNINFFAFIQSGDSDGDGIDDWFERFNLSTDPFDPDSDHDGMDDGWELSHGLDPGSSRDAWLDADDDGVANIEEYTHGTDPENPDTDGDGIADRDEIGWVKLKASAQLPLANENTVYICTPPVGMVSSGVYPFSLPFPVRLCGRTCTHGYADVKGVVHFQTADDTTVPSSLGDNEALPSSSLPDGISVAAYWDSLRLRGGVSSIRLSDVTVDGRRHAVIEYHTVGTASADLRLLTFRVAVCQQATNEVEVQYGELDDPAEGQSATFGVQGPGQWPRIQYSCNAPSAVAEGLSLVYHLGSGSDPLLTDTDEDSLPDGWEVNGGLAPNSASGDDGPDGDPDDDGLSNWSEFVLGSSPMDKYSFSSIWTDGQWAENGRGPLIGDGVSVLVSVGDPSPSHSERWKLRLDDTVESGRHYVVPCEVNGTVALSALRLERGRHYVGTLEHIDSTLSSPDYDWTAQIDGWPQTQVLPAGESHGEASGRHLDFVKSLRIDNFDGLLGLCNDAFGSYDNRVGKHFDIYTVKTQISGDKFVPYGFQLPIMFSLTADSDQTANWSIEPVLPDGARLFVDWPNGTGATAIDGVGQVLVSSGQVATNYTITARHPTFYNSFSTATFSVCTFKVENIRFNFDRGGTTNDAINIRSDVDTAGFDYPVGEWANEGFVNYPACYKGGVLPKIQARFSMVPRSTVTARFFAGQSSVGSPIGGLVDEPVHFIDGESGWVTFTSSRTVETKVSRGEAAFDWQLVNIGGIPFPPTPFYATGPHRIYTILADPVAPWSSDPNSSQCAWTNALEWACTHAARASTFGEAAVGVTSAINSSGRFLYGTWDGSARYFESDVFDFRTLQLTECVRRLNGGNGNGQGVNCTDCAMFVMAFSNLLGCSLYCSQMQGDFDTNPFVAIGYTDWDSPFGNGQWHFIYHEVAWDGDCGDTDLVYDACLRYDGDDDPSGAPHVAVLPAGVVFSDGSPYAPLVYRERLAYPSSSGYGRCCACPGTKRRLDELQ